MSSTVTPKHFALPSLDSSSTPLPFASESDVCNGDGANALHQTLMPASELGVASCGPNPLSYASYGAVAERERTLRETSSSTVAGFGNPSGTGWDQTSSLYPQTSSHASPFTSPLRGCLPFPWVRLNAGGTTYVTSHLTLQAAPDSVLGQLSQLLLGKRIQQERRDKEPPSSPSLVLTSSPFAELLPMGVDRDPMDGSVLLDVDPILFSHVLQYLRAEEKQGGEWSIPEASARDVSGLRTLARTLRLTKLEQRLHPRRCLLAWGSTETGEFGVGGCGGNRFLVVSPSVARSRRRALQQGPPSVAAPTTATTESESSDRTGTASGESGTATAPPTTTTTTSETTTNEGATVPTTENSATDSVETSLTPTPTPAAPPSTPTPSTTTTPPPTTSTTARAAKKDEKFRKKTNSILLRTPIEMQMFPARRPRWRSTQVKAEEPSSCEDDKDGNDLEGGSNYSQREVPRRGRSTITQRGYPVEEEVLCGGVVQVALGLTFACFRTAPGEVFTCGEGRLGQLGLGEHGPTGVDQPQRVQFPWRPPCNTCPHPPSQAVPLPSSCTTGSTEEKGRVSGVTVDETGVHGTSSLEMSAPAPKSKEDDTTTKSAREREYAVTHIGCSNSCVMAVTRDHHVFFWGNNDHSQGGLGHGEYFTPDVHAVFSPVCVEALEPRPNCHIVEAYCGVSFGVARSEEGEVFTWGVAECLGLGENVISKLQEREEQEREAKRKKEREYMSFFYNRPGGAPQGEEAPQEDGKQEETEPARGGNTMKEAMNAVLDVREERERRGIGRGGGGDLPISSIWEGDEALEPPPAYRHVGMALTRDHRQVVVLPQRVVFPTEEGRHRTRCSTSGGECGSFIEKSFSVVPITSIKVGQAHACALNARGEVYTWGVGYQGRLGLGDTQTVWTPRRVEGGGLLGYRVKAVSCGSFHTAALTEDGFLFVWGDNSQNQCGEKGMGRQMVRGGRERTTSEGMDVSWDGYTPTAASREMWTLPRRVEVFDTIGSGVVTAVSCGKNHTFVVVAGPHYPPYHPIPAYYYPFTPLSPPSASPMEKDLSTREVSPYSLQKREPDMEEGAARTRLLPHRPGFNGTGALECVWREEWRRQGQPFLMGTGSEWDAVAEVLVPLKGTCLPVECIPSSNSTYHASIGLRRRGAGIRALTGFEQYHILDVFAGRGATFFLAEDLASAC